ncbi:MAG: translation initiation factor eIF-1A [Candidatus Altiarchaeales archaeon]|nr:MAG: translation initiation factor eIF-1A [Candidatus Altiarchaeales archaeon]RLI95298.1 MAG: translation initiation factor eIF-1A [Candidatus Altiarchaeales archaeon]RLI95515.1 MAG: translation initiation factor eIF-1A [Candidatus Altiarchaeales archaeon]
MASSNTSARVKKGEVVQRVRIPRDGQILGEVEQLLGDRRMLVKCVDGHRRLCRIPGKIRRRIWIKEGNIVLVQPWLVQSDERGDILWRYTNQQADWLRRRGYLKGLENEY